MGDALDEFMGDALDENASPSLTPPVSDETLDLRGLKCPLPVLRTRKALASLPEGATLLVHCTDALAAIDLPHFLRQTGDLLLARHLLADGMTFHIRKAEKQPR